MKLIPRISWRRSRDKEVPVQAFPQTASHADRHHDHDDDDDGNAGNDISTLVDDYIVEHQSSDDEEESLFATNFQTIDTSQADSLAMQTVMGERLVRYILRRAANGVKLAGREPISSAQKLADKYASNKRYATVDEKVKAMVQHETAKGFACGFGTSVGGVWTTLTVGAPAGMILSFCIQARLVSAIAILYGQNIVSQPTETLVLLSMIGSMSMISRLVREAAEVSVTRMTTRAVSKVVATSSARTLLAIKRRIGIHILARVLPKSSAKTFMTSSSSVIAPVVGNIAGGLLGGVLDAVSIRMSAKLACKVFRDGSLTSGALLIHTSIPRPAIAPPSVSSDHFHRQDSQQSPVLY